METLIYMEFVLIIYILYAKIYETLAEIKDKMK